MAEPQPHDHATHHVQLVEGAPAARLWGRDATLSVEVEGHGVIGQPNVLEHFGLQVEEVVVLVGGHEGELDAGLGEADVSAKPPWHEAVALKVPPSVGPVDITTPQLLALVDITAGNQRDLGERPPFLPVQLKQATAGHQVADLDFHVRVVSVLQQIETEGQQWPAIGVLADGSRLYQGHGFGPLLQGGAAPERLPIFVELQCAGRHAPAAGR
mmetsp:Transcript_101859/g.287369  ORF Transcript_101859/g.287369 Transcript_101859/m.287369 type:complete len:213 (+) Transcript_101859:470-1108(+)